MFIQIVKKILFMIVMAANVLAYSGFKGLFCPEYITIYVHGTKTPVGIRLLNLIYKDMSFGAPGIHSLDDLSDSALLRKDAELLSYLSPLRFNIDHYYTFGWSGTLSIKARKEAGKVLYQELVELLNEYQNKFGMIPKVRILTFSHGGNVALHMVEHLPFFEHKKIYLELVLVAVPVQKTTEHLIEHPDISRSYVISSSKDLLQVVDRYKYGKKRYWPQRFFNTQCSNCSQIKVKINNHGLGHVELLRSFMIHLPYVLDFADDQCRLNFCNNHSRLVLDCNIYDSSFIFFHGFNLVKVIRGKRKNENLFS